MKTPDDLTDSRIVALVALDAQRAHREAVERLLTAATANAAATAYLGETRAFAALTRSSPEWSALVIAQRRAPLLTFLGARELDDGAKDACGRGIEG